MQRYAQIDPVIAVIAIGELYYGAQRAQRPERQRALITNLISSSKVVLCDEETARHYASIRYRLEQQGIRMPENDIWIAAAAEQHQLPIATRDGHFRSLTWMTIEFW